MGGKVGENPAALRAAVFSLSSKNLRGGRSNAPPPPSRARVNIGFVTSFEDNRYILLFRYIYGAHFIQWFCYSKHLHVNRNYRPNGTATSLFHKCYSANVPLDFCTTADLEMKYFLNEGTAGVLGNTYLIF